MVAQEEEIFSKEELEQLQELEDTIALLSFAVVNDSLPEHRFGATKQLIKSLVNALKIPKSFQYPFPKVKAISIQYPADSTFRIFTWQLYVDQNEYRYYGAIQMASDSLQLFPLIDRSFTIEDTEFDLLDPENWYGALYYNVHQFEAKDGPGYLLFGYDGFSFFDKRKLVDVLHFQTGKPQFGAPVFVETDTLGNVLMVRNRIVKEYNAEASMRLNYDPVLEHIVFDHLIPFGGHNVPDGSYEGYKYEKGVWIYVPKMFDQVLEEPPRPEPVLDDKSKNIFGEKRQ